MHLEQKASSTRFPCLACKAPSLATTRLEALHASPGARSASPGASRARQKASRAGLVSLECRAPELESRGSEACTQSPQPCTCSSRPCTQSLQPCIWSVEPCAQGLEPCKRGSQACAQSSKPRVLHRSALGHASAPNAPASVAHGPDKAATAGEGGAQAASGKRMPHPVRGSFCPVRPLRFGSFMCVGRRPW